LKLRYALLGLGIPHFPCRFKVRLALRDIGRIEVLYGLREERSSCYQDARRNGEDVIRFREEVDESRLAIRLRPILPARLLLLLLLLAAVVLG